MGKHPLFAPIFFLILWGHAVRSWEKLTTYKQLLQNFLNGCRLCFKSSIVERGSKKPHTLSLPWGTFWKRVCPTSCFETSGKSLRMSSYNESESLVNSESQRKPPQYEGVIRRPTLYRRFRDPQCHPMKAMGLHQPLEKRHQLMDADSHDQNS